MEKLIRLLHEGNYSLVVAHGEIRTFSGRGVSDLYALSGEDPGFLRGASVADKVVGKAAAALMILGEVGELHADVVSRPALDLFADSISRLALDLLAGSGVKVGYAEEVPHVINRSGTGWCPLETRCRDLRTPEECVAQIRDFMNAMNNR